MDKVRLCIVGCGSVARLHSRIARTLRSHVTLSYASRTPAKAQEYNQRFGGNGAFGSYEEACLSPHVDAIFLCTPHALHVEHVRLAASGHKAVLIEKPVARTLDEFAQIEAAVTDAGVSAMVAENYFFKPLVRVLRDHLQRGDIGAPLLLEVNRVNRSTITGWRADAEMMGGGALLEGGVHWVNLFVEIGGDVNQVIAAKPTKPYRMIAPVEDNLELLVKFADGSVGKLLHSWNLHNRIAGLAMSKIFGTDGNIHFESNGVVVVVLGKRKRVRFPGFLDIMGYRAMLRHFVDCVRDQSPPAMSLAVARRDMEVVMAAYRSLESHRFESVKANDE